jgi:polar amino acid transport system substrate-binding protein
VGALLLAGCAAAPSVPVADIAPTGSLRVAIGVGPSPSAFWAVKDPSTGEPKGVTVELGKAAARKLGVPVKLVEYPNSGEITAAAGKGAWDISFMPQDPAREKLIDPGPAYVTYVTTYIVRAGSTIRNAGDVDQPGVRVGGVEGTATSRALARTLEHARLVLFKEAGEAQAELAQGKLDALAQGREALLDFAKKAPGTRVLADPIVSTSVIVVVPKGRAATRAWAATFLEEAKADGTVRRALDSAGFRDASVAPSSDSSR